MPVARRSRTLPLTALLLVGAACGGGRAPAPAPEPVPDVVRIDVVPESLRAAPRAAATTRTTRRTAAGRCVPSAWAPAS